MALYSNLPVYKLAYDLLIEIYNRTHFFSREHKYTLGEKLKTENLELLLAVYKANKSRAETRLVYIESARQNIEIVRLLLRVAKDLKVLAVKAFVLLNQKVEKVSIQLVQWQKYTKSQ